MKSKQYLKYLASDQWNEIKAAIITKRGYKCEKCGSTKWIQLHHKNYDFELGKEKAEELILLCNKCHKDLHN